MPMYALAMHCPKIALIRKDDGNIVQTWYADDVSAVGQVEHVREWWDKLSSTGPKFGYFANASKKWLVTKKAHFGKATAEFADTSMKVTCKGRPYRLGNLTKGIHLHPM